MSNISSETLNMFNSRATFLLLPLWSAGLLLTKFSWKLQIPFDVLIVTFYVYLFRKKFALDVLFNRTIFIGFWLSVVVSYGAFKLTFYFYRSDFVFVLTCVMPMLIVMILVDFFKSKN